MFKIIRTFMIHLGILKFRIGDKVIPNSDLFMKEYKFDREKEYGVVTKVIGNYIYITGCAIPYSYSEAVLYRSNKTLIKELMKTILYVSAITGSVMLGAMIAVDSNIILGILVAFICILSVFYDFFKTNNF